MINLLKSKIQELVVSESSLDYPGSISLPIELIRMANLTEFEQVFVNNKTSGARISTYVVLSKQNGFVSLNGAASHHFKKGDIIHVLSYRMVDEAEAPRFRPTLVRANDKNEVIEAIPYFI
ncbi:aspartate 1-decarboxylase [Fluviicola taffensis]|uniref:Aspartate decarboxylase n=1 Tax=Fluviicola taffensis (strain DSM 16823 / NCIMB 13979 / RW262) TaxID=755732 RepID=F2IFP5_FLUTR|nr:aspartate 1-decarboxylase [Fluviicola taffensis]AEA42503.1 aspartate decarboxylase [Fluviicola taffensis DSM 16823]